MADNCGFMSVRHFILFCASLIAVGAILSLASVAAHAGGAADKDMQKSQQQEQQQRDRQQQLQELELFVGFDESNDARMTGYACEGSELQIRCAADQTLHIIDANYGRLNRTWCNDKKMLGTSWTIPCRANDSLAIVRNKCESSNYCGVRAIDSIFAPNCVSTTQGGAGSSSVFEGSCDSELGCSYLEVEYTCNEQGEKGPTTPPYSPPTIVAMTSETPVPHHSVALEDIKEEGDVTPTGSALAGYCEGEKKRSVGWPATREGVISVQPCPNNNNIRRARWRCGEGGLWIGAPDLSECVSETVLGIIKLMTDLKTNGGTAENVLEVLDIMLTTSQQSGEDIYGGDLTNLLYSMKDAVDMSTLYLGKTMTNERAAEMAQQINSVVLNTSSSLLEESLSDGWVDLPATLQARTATTLLGAVETSAFLLANNTNNGSATITYPNIIIGVNSLSFEQKSSRSLISDGQALGKEEAKEDLVVFPSTGNSGALGVSSWKSPSASGNVIKLSSDTIQAHSVDGVTKVVFAMYNNVGQWMTPGKTPQNSERLKRSSVNNSSSSSSSSSSSPPKDPMVQLVVNTVIISASMNGREGLQLNSPVEFTLEHNVKENISQPSCVYWKYSPMTHDGEWSDDGCHVVSSNSTHTTCACDHLTNFAVLMATTSHQLSEEHQFALSLITYFGCMFSIVCLLLAFITFHSFKSLQCDRNTIHKNLTLCLFMAELIFMIGIVQYNYRILCSIIAVALHYLFLSSFAWMCLEGVQLYVLLVEVFEAEKSRLKWYYAGAYGIPVAIVGIALAVDYTGYGTKQHCWLSVENGFIWAFVGPVVAIVAVNLVMLSIALHAMCKHAANAVTWRMKHSTTLETVGSWLKGAFVLVILLGSTWIFGLFYINQQSLFMAYIFTLCNSLQGVFIFLFHCLLSDKVQKEYRRKITKTTWLPESFRSRFGTRAGTVGASTAQQNQTSSSAGGGNYLFKLLRNRSGKSYSNSAEKTLKKKMVDQNNQNDKVLILITPPGVNGSPNRPSPRGVCTSSSGSDSARLTISSGLPVNSDHYLGATDSNTEEPSGYLEPSLTMMDEREFASPDNFEMSVAMETNSVMEMEYTTHHKKPASVTGESNSVTAVTAATAASRSCDGGIEQLVGRDSQSSSCRQQRDSCTNQLVEKQEQQPAGSGKKGGCAEGRGGNDTWGGEWGVGSMEESSGINTTENISSSIRTNR